MVGVGARLRETWTRLVEPSPRVVGLEERRQARLLAALLLVISINDTIAYFVSRPAGKAVLLPLTVATTILYFVSRGPRPKVAAWLLISGLAAAMFAVLRLEQAYDLHGVTATLAWLSLALICGQIFLSSVGLIVVCVALIGATAALPLFLPIAPADTGPAIGVLFAVGSFLLVFQRHREGLERDRLAELEVLNARLEAEAAAADAANVAKSRFLQNMSHELRTPLNVVIGYIELVRESEELSDEGDRDLKRALTASEHLVTTIGDILDLSRIESGKVVTQVEEGEVGALMDLLQTLVAPLAQASANSFEVRREAEGPLRTDLVRLRQALLNLLSNAFKFTRAGEITLTARDAARPGWIEFEVRDTGVGIEPEVLESIFRAFVQADDSATRRFGGVGLGLTITREVARILGGEIKVASAVGQGSTFTMAIPRVHPSLADAALAAR